MAGSAIIVEWAKGAPRRPGGRDGGGRDGGGRDGAGGGREIRERGRVSGAANVCCFLFCEIFFMCSNSKQRTGTNMLY